MRDPSLWQYLAFAVSFIAVAAGVTVTAIAAFARLFEWFYPDKESADERAYLDAIAGAERDYLAEMGRRAARDPLGAFGAGRVVGHPSRGSHD